MTSNLSPAPFSIRDTIIQATAELLIESGREAVTTRAVAKAASVQAPAIYRQFGDMHGLLDAVLSYQLDLYLQSLDYQSASHDPIEALRVGWNCNVNFGLSYPAFSSLMYADARPAQSFTAVRQTLGFLQGLVQRVAEAGQLGLNVIQATQMIHSACCGTILTLLRQAETERDLTLSALMREATIAAILISGDPDLSPPDGLNSGPNSGPVSRVASRAVALKAVLPEATDLTGCESGLLAEWLDRLSQT